MNEKIFDFGPLLVGKTEDKKGTIECMKMNSSTFNMCNIKRVPSNIEFSLMS